jgi:hypothetical protein
MFGYVLGDQPRPRFDRHRFVTAASLGERAPSHERSGTLDTIAVQVSVAPAPGGNVRIRERREATRVSEVDGGAGCRSSFRGCRANSYTAGSGPPEPSDRASFLLKMSNLPLPPQRNGTVGIVPPVPDQPAPRPLLPLRWQEYLRGMPESGMGYQRLTIRFADGRAVGATVIQSAYVADWPDDLPFLPDEIVAIELRP